MGGCATKPKEFDGQITVVPTDPDATVKNIESDNNAPQEEVKTETTKEEYKEAPLLDLSEPKPDADKGPVIELAPEISELKTDDVVVKAEEPAVIKAVDVTEEKEKVEEVKQPAVVAVEEKEKESVAV